VARDLPGQVRLHAVRATGDPGDRGGQSGRRGEQRYRHRTVHAGRTGVEVPVRGRADPRPGEGEVDGTVSGAHDRDGLTVRVADGRTVRDRHLVAPVQYGGEERGTARGGGHRHLHATGVRTVCQRHGRHGDGRDGTGGGRRGDGQREAGTR